MNKLEIISIATLIIILAVNLSNELSSEWLLTPYIIGFIIYLVLRIDARFFALLAIITLIIAGITLAMDKEEYANYIAIGTYYSLVMTVILMLINDLTNRKNKLELEEAFKIFKNDNIKAKYVRKTNIKTKLNIIEKLVYSSKRNIIPAIIITLIIGITYLFIYLERMEKSYKFLTAETNLFYASIFFITITTILIIFRIYGKIKYKI